MKKLLPLLLLLTSCVDYSDDIILDDSNLTPEVPVIETVDYSAPYSVIKTQETILLDPNSLGYYSQCSYDATSITADFNLDGFVDILLSPQCYEENDNRQPPMVIFFNDGTDNFIPDYSIIENNVGSLSGVRKMVVGDFNGDKIPDVAFSAHGDHDGNFGVPGLVLSKEDSFEFIELNQVPRRWWAQITSGDIDNDGDLDLLIGGNDYGALINDGKANFSYSKDIFNNINSNLAVKSLFDLNSDGYLDLFIEGTEEDKPWNYVLWGSPTGYSREKSLPFNKIFYDGIQWELDDVLIRDFDNDGIVEILTQNEPPGYRGKQEFYVGGYKYDPSTTSITDVTDTLIENPYHEGVIVFLRSGDIDADGVNEVFQNVDISGRTIFIRKFIQGIFRN